MASDELATGLKATKGIEFLTAPTPNGIKVSILLEELKEAYGKDYTWQSINLYKSVQKEPWFIAVNPNGRIPAIVDHDKGGFAVFESLGILLYLTRQYDPEHRFSFADPLDISRSEQWLAWHHGGVGPMHGQANYFSRFAKEKIPFPIQRYAGEAERLYGVLDHHLEGRDYIVGEGRGKYSIADIANFGWAAFGLATGLEIERFPNLVRWVTELEKRPAVQRGIAVPYKTNLTHSAYKKKLEEEPETRKEFEGFVELITKAKEQYEYKYTSP
ncbi:glutathione S-transferase [Eremomyces bilateralis CBS 781.70]|uniref:Glutathione S-transferase n=1 Tax=Eremomyces bilateralis CBS 781.70 TaxID=1392243 RepID=A0A6G1GFE0_9PEZI|nr:glutathione S-transferase [Eremomyces bilateralis CBS 781.70]KAF1816570.1 glutathione S-transferase [Eremomyces bilateralis CBS 781.70]